MSSSTFITRVGLKNYKSIAQCDVRLGSLTFLVGANGSGKSNFLDALRLVADALRTSLDHALRDRGGVNEVRRRSARRPTHFGIRLDFTLASGQRGFYAFYIGALREGRYEVAREECRISPPEVFGGQAFFVVEAGRVVDSSAQVAPAAIADRLYLVNASGLSEFRPVYDALSHMGFYNLNPDCIRDLQTPEAGDLLARDGRNLASVLAQLATRHRKTKDRIEEYLSRVVQGISEVQATSIGPKETLRFKQQVAGAKRPWGFQALNMSDGTLRALGILVALFQSVNGETPHIPLVGIEEPEIALHPAAAGVLLDAIREASHTTQVVVTSHSPELLDNRSIPSDSILAVLATGGSTRIGPLDEVNASILREGLYTAGELLRLDQLAPDLKDDPEATQLDLFARLSE